MPSWLRASKPRGIFALYLRIVTTRHSNVLHIDLIHIGWLMLRLICARQLRSCIALTDWRH